MQTTADGTVKAADTRPAVLASIPRDIASASDYERYARARLDDNAWTFLTAGAADEVTLRDNRAAFDRIRMRSRVLGKVQGGHTRLALFGQRFEHPVFLAPIGYQKLFHPDGEAASALAARAMSAPLIVSTLATTRLEELAATGATLWFQLYLRARRADTLSLVRRAEQCGCTALVVTVDAPLAGIRNREQRAGFHLPPGIDAVNLTDLPGTPTQALPPGACGIFEGLLANAPTWDDVAWLAANSALPVIVKGILHPADALLAIEHGARGIVVSNHGGRILDTLPASIDALPDVAAAVAGRVPLLLDGGIRRGSDVFKAIALGAQAVLVGRAYAHALAAAGSLGVAHVIRTLREELEVCMALNGCATLDAIDAATLVNRGM
ncbi:MAG TPA: alpha-hydroxy acid oxidase [Pseudomonadales bacterium]